MVKVRCPHCGGSLDVCIASGDLRRLQNGAATTALLTAAENDIRKASRLSDVPEVILHTTEATKALDEAYKALLDDLDQYIEEADL